MTQLKALYRLANEQQIFLIKGVVVEGIAEGFTFADFDNAKTFTISPNNHLPFYDQPALDFKLKENTEEWRSTTSDEYDFGFSIIQNEIEKGHIKKAILSRKVAVAQKVDPLKLFQDLEQAYPNAHVFLTETPNGDLWIGASPETLLKQKGSVYSTMSLAGTKSGVDVEWTEKEYEEQRIVTNSIVAELFGLDIDPEISDLETVKAGEIYHLRNLIQFETTKNQSEIVQALHPTPAISGFPKKQSLTTIKVAENHAREFYCGYIGIMNANRNSTFFVNLRCAKIQQNQIQLYVGGGITIDSVKEKEWEECDRKAQSLLRFV